MNNLKGLTNEEYYAAVKRLGLRPSNVPHIYVTSDGDVHPVPDGTKHTPEQKAEIVEKLKGTFGIFPSDRMN
jgi:hypothetical protein